MISARRTHGRRRFGFQREIGRDLAFSMDGVFIRGADLLRLRDLNAPRFTGPYPAGQEVAFANLNRPTIPASNGFRRVDRIESSGRSEYKAVYMNLTKRLRAKYVSAFLHFWRARRMTCPWAATPYPHSLDMDAEWGPALNDIRHTIAANAVAELPLGFTAGGIFLAYSGRPYTAQLGYDFNGDGTNNDRPQGVGKGTLTGKAFAKLDLFSEQGVSPCRAVQAQPPPGSVRCFSIASTRRNTATSWIPKLISELRALRRLVVCKFRRDSSFKWGRTTLGAVSSRHSRWLR